MFYQLDYKMTKFRLFNAFAAPGGKVVMPGGREGIIQSLTRESGSGQSYIVCVLITSPVPLKESFVVQTID